MSDPAPPGMPRVYRLGQRLVVEGADTCTCGAPWVGWDKGVTTIPHPRDGWKRTRVLRAHATLRCAAGHRTELDEAC